MEAGGKIIKFGLLMSPMLLYICSLKYLPLLLSGAFFYIVLFITLICDLFKPKPIRLRICFSLICFFFHCFDVEILGTP